MSERPAPVLPRPLGPHAPVELYWLPLGAGGHSVRFNGRVFEAISALLQRRPRCDLYHAALEVHLPEGRFVIEMTPVPRDAGGVEARAVATGPVGSRLAGRLRLFRYEIRCWRDGTIPDLAEAVDSPRAVCVRAEQARWLLRLAPLVPTPVWGRDELAAGEMWNSNSVVAWLLERGGLDAASVAPPRGGRAPGWSAGIAVARREAHAIHTPAARGQRVAASQVRLAGS
ncbi:MAG TPA: hypothetical protein VN618_13945 [Solirubrobacteraceae bacterium]|nr:hypothetical protein [Solirubrobacteraceae bacterium]